MKVIDLLVKIANGEEVKFKIIDEQEDYYCKENDFLRRYSDNQEVDWWLDSLWLNKEVEIIEEEKELHANEIVFNCDNNKRECVITLDENDLGIDKLHMDNCYFYKENGKWYVKKYDFKTIKLEEEKKIPEKINLKLDDWTTPTQCDIELSKKIDEIIDYLKSKGE